MPVGFYFSFFFLLRKSFAAAAVFAVAMPVVDYGGMIVSMYTSH